MLFDEDEFAKDHSMTLVDVHSILSSDTYTDAYNAEVRRLKDTYQPGDQCWYYCSKDELWAEHMGSEGYLLVRNNVVIDSIVSRMN